MLGTGCCHPEGCQHVCRMLTAPWDRRGLWRRPVQAEGEPGCSSRGGGEVSEEAVSGAWFWRMGFPCGSTGKESACNEGDLGSIPGLGRSPGEGKGYPLQYSVLKNSMDCIVNGVEKMDTTERLSLRFTGEELELASFGGKM